MLYLNVYDVNLLDYVCYYILVEFKQDDIVIL